MESESQVSSREESVILNLLVSYASHCKPSATAILWGCGHVGGDVFSAFALLLWPLDLDEIRRSASATASHLQLQSCVHVGGDPFSACALLLRPLDLDEIR